MENLEKRFMNSLQKLKVYEINKMKRMQRDQEAFFKEVREFFEQEVIVKKSQDDFLSPKQVNTEYGYSRKTFDRWIADGLEILQRTPGSSIRVKRKDLESYLNEKYHVR